MRDLSYYQKKKVFLLSLPRINGKVKKKKEKGKRIDVSISNCADPAE